MEKNNDSLNILARDAARKGRPLEYSALRPEHRQAVDKALRGTRKRIEAFSAEHNPQNSKEAADEN